MRGSLRDGGVVAGGLEVDDGDAAASGGERADPGFFRAVAADYDGTLTKGDRPDPDTLAALDQTRAAGRRVVIVTGRILADLLEVFPDAARHADLIVAENGAVLARSGRHRVLAEPVPAELAAALTGRGVSCRRGQVLLACRGADELAVLDEVRTLGLECQLIRNRAELMVLPAGVSKGTGLAAGLADLGISAHNAVAIGDAENDHSLLAAAELGVAVGNAVDALKTAADLVLAEEDGAGVSAFLQGPVLAGRERVHPRRWRVALGALADGTPVSVPASQINMLVTGVPQRGKSYVAGLIAERLSRLGYSLVVFDPEGDHAGLSELGALLVTSAARGLPSPQDLARVASHHRGAVVVDLSALPANQRSGYLNAAHRQLDAERAATGLPHWLILDEARVALDRNAHSFFEPARAGYCLVTHRPEDLRPETLLAIDVLIALPGAHLGSTADIVAAAAPMPRAAAARLLGQAGPGQALLVDREHPGTGLVFTISDRETNHMHP